MTQAQKSSQNKNSESPSENQTGYKDKIADLLNKYEEGWDVFKKASDWTDAIHIKPEFQGDVSLPQNWIELADRVISIIAHDKYGLDTYDNNIEIIDADQMLEAYTKVGMPVMYDHWSFGKQRTQLDRQYEGGQMGLAYEIIINTAPAIAYCMEQNTPTMQMLVIAHASYGHNSFFKNNYMFRQFTKADEIIGDMKRLRDMVKDAEEKYGLERVEKLLDACHALETHSVDKYTKPKGKLKKDIEREAAEKEERQRLNYNELIESTKLRSTRDKFNAANDEKAAPKAIPPGALEENLLMYVANYAPHLEQWERDIVKYMASKAQYFYPQRQTQVMNEGWASFWHYTLMNDLSDLDLIDDGMMLEFLDSHSGVTAQPKTRLVQDPMTGEVKEVPGFFQMNVYALGFAMFQDIKRICMEPTEEDKEWFPHFAGNGDWLGTIKEAMENFKDESFILQYLSPKVIRDFSLFSLDLDEKNPYYEVSAIHDDEGYKHVRRALASNYRLGDNMPQIIIDDYNYKGDRSLTLRHHTQNDKPIHAKDTQEVLKHLYQLWQHPVRLKILDENEEVDNILGIPEPTTDDFLRYDLLSK